LALELKEKTLITSHRLENEIKHNVPEDIADISRRAIASVQNGTEMPADIGTLYVT